MQIRTLRFQFRWPVEQTDQKKIEVKIPLVEGDPLVSLNQEQIKSLGLTVEEYDKAVDLAETAVFTSIAIIK